MRKGRPLNTGYTKETLRQIKEMTKPPDTTLWLVRADWWDERASNKGDLIRGLLNKSTIAIRFPPKKKTFRKDGKKERRVVARGFIAFYPGNWRDFPRARAFMRKGHKTVKVDGCITVHKDPTDDTDVKIELHNYFKMPYEN